MKIKDTICSKTAKVNNGVRKSYKISFFSPVSTLRFCQLSGWHLHYSKRSTGGLLIEKEEKRHTKKR